MAPPVVTHVSPDDRCPSGEPGVTAGGAITLHYTVERLP